MDHPADNIKKITWEPGSNRNLLQFSVLRIRIKVWQHNTGSMGPFRVIIRTNLNQARRIRQQIIDLVEKGRSYSTDFYDIFARYDRRRDEYGVDILLYEVGYFEFKVRVEGASHDRPWVKWADGANIGISVWPLEYARNNAIYCAFIRQYVSDKSRSDMKDSQLEESIINLEKQGAYVIPPGGNFKSFMEVLPFIINQLGMKIIHLLPINPVPVAYGRMGMYGSPYATTDYFGIEHTYGAFSRYQTIEEQFIDLTSTIHDLGGKVILDMVINHTGWAGSIHFTHRHWRKVAPDGKIISPGAWDVVWGDLVELDYRHQDLWQYMAKVFLVWCSRGIDGFRLDAGYKVPLEVWRYIISKVRQAYPNTLFLLEGLGGSWEATEKLLTEGQMDWAYSELFQNYSRKQILDYLEYAQRISAGKGILVHYAETHDNDRLAKKGKTYARMRVYLSALTSFAGAWGVTNGLEWLATEKIDVHRNAGLNWGHDDNLVQDIAQLNKILRENPAFWLSGNLRPVDLGDVDLLGFIRHRPEHNNTIVCLLNLNVDSAKSFRWDLAAGELARLFEAPVNFYDLLKEKSPAEEIEKIWEGTIPPGDCLLYRLTAAYRPAEPVIPAVYEIDPDKTSLIYRILLSRFQAYEVGRINQEKLLRQVNDFRQFIALVHTTSLQRLMRGNLAEDLQKIDDDLIERFSSVWSFDDRHKEFIVSGDKWLAVHTYMPGTVYLKTPAGTQIMEAMPDADESGYWAYFPPQPENKSFQLTFNWKIRQQGIVRRKWQEVDYPILSVPSARKAPRPRRIYPLRLSKAQVRENFATVFLTNGVGGVSQFPARPGAIHSKYDGLLGITPNWLNPAERLVLVKMIRETVQVGNKFFDLDDSFLSSFVRYPQPRWEFIYDDGEYYLILERSAVMPPGENSVYIRYMLREANAPITLICKCYLECRWCHHQLQADEDLKIHYAQSLRPLMDRSGVQFCPQEGIDVRLAARKGEYVSQPHWISNLNFPLDGLRGLEDRGDAFSPGLFNMELNQGTSQVLVFTADQASLEAISYYRAAAEENKQIKNLLAMVPAPQARNDPLIKMLAGALNQFIIHTDRGGQMLAGFPWLGVRVREALHMVGGLLAAGRGGVARDIILNCAPTEQDGLLLDWLSGDSKIRSNVEASLRLFLAVQDYATGLGDDTFWDRRLGDRRCLREVLVSIYEHFRDHAAGGVSLDQATGMLFCPAGFTWMNTHDPDSTPRAGYPVEVQALWYRALEVLAKIYPPYAEQVRQWRDLIRQKFMSLFWDEKRGYLADVLSAENNISAEKASGDFSLRFNQLAAFEAQLTPPDKTRHILDVIARKLLIPAGVRSLAEDPLPTPLRIVDRQGKMMTDPRLPYQGRCIGAEAARRLAYHNGSAWGWAYPGFIEARAAVYNFSELAVKQALAFLEPVWSELASGGVGTLAEIKDGNYPHAPRECYAYALSVAETLRVYMRLKYRYVPGRSVSGQSALVRNIT